MSRTQGIFGVAALAAVLFLNGCATGTSGSQVQAAIRDTHKRVVQLDNDMDDSLGKLNETTAELNTRVDRNDEQMRLLQSVSEENQVRLEKLDRRLAELQKAAYQQWNLTAPSAERRSSSSGPTVDIEPPAWREPQQQEPVESTPDLDPAREMPSAEPAPSPETARSEPARTQPPDEDEDEEEAQEDAGDPKEAYQKAQRFYAEGDYSEALSMFDNFLQRYDDPELRANAQFWKAKCYLNIDQYREAIGEFQQVVEGYPGSTKVPFAMHNQAVAHSRLGETDQAMGLLEQVIEDYPSTPAADQAKSDLEKLGG